MQFLLIDSAEVLRDHLDNLNERGIDPLVVGMDENQPFMIVLQGPYAEYEAVIFGVPWDSEIDWNKPLRCEECNCRELFDIDDLAYPVRVMARNEER